MKTGCRLSRVAWTGTILGALVLLGIAVSKVKLWDEKESEVESYALRQAFKIEIMELRKQNSLVDLIDVKDAISVESLQLCSSKTSSLYPCVNDPTCVSRTTCQHPDGSRHKWQDPNNHRRFWEQKEERRAVIRRLLERMESVVGLNTEKQLLIMVVNIGYVHLFSNWYCSVKANIADVDRVKRYSLILATDEAAIQIVQSMGFFTPSLEEFNVISRWLMKPIDTGPPPTTFGGSHGTLNLVLKLAMPLDLIHLGYWVMFQDVDVIWVKDALTLIRENERQYCGQEKECDVFFIHNSTPFFNPKDQATSQWRRSENSYLGKLGYPEGNTGLCLLRPSRRMESFLTTLMAANRLQRWDNRDQLLWNTLIYHGEFEDTINVGFLPMSIFRPGVPEEQHIATKYYMPDPKDFAVYHAAWAYLYTDKYQRFRDLRHWYFDDARCGEDAVKACKASPACWGPMNNSIERYNERHS